MLWFPVCRNFYVCTILWGNGARAAKARLLLYGGNLPKLGEFPNIGLNQGAEPIIIRMVMKTNTSFAGLVGCWHQDLMPMKMALMIKIMTLAMMMSVRRRGIGNDG